MRFFLSLIIMLGFLGAHKTIATPIAQEKTPPISLEALLKSDIQSVADHEVLISRVTMQPHQTLPRHTHPTEEYLYVLSGKTILKLDGDKNIELIAGTAYKIPAKTIHSALTTDEITEIIVFRVHTKGKPVRTLVD
ncbi:cupin domain-containing protein [Kordiimonas sp. SCSIO 12610]|uniref:cupin domain-containing protein n=1 Tax=Kordiimonas sp. SCSIO 12610 TaxID=2829597 RepID=UPI00210A95B9|nr:cupin domain-containing protein [Kordiimonas sp. SCSIO 12610]UTW54568.1 cupin domain-containing protein [Kordiimonas sp. SCSIO 12610]